ncbi:hypothetical protein [Burkholderia phage FLC9]|nr:hypothetical protein [Burkholderia phage FLC9]
MSQEIGPSPEAAKASATVAGLQADRSKLDSAIVAAFNRQHPGSFARNWPEDFPHENGMYECICLHCRHHFLGYKRRMTCKSCANPTPKES